MKEKPRTANRGNATSWSRYFTSTCILWHISGVKCHLKIKNISIQMMKLPFKCVFDLFLLMRFLPLLDLGLLGFRVSNLQICANKMFSPPAEIAAADDLRSDKGKVLVEWKNNKDILIGRICRVCVKYRSTASNLKAKIELKCADKGIIKCKIYVHIR